MEMLMKNDEEDNELRVEAFMLIAKSNPSQLVESLDAEFIKKESNIQVTLKKFILVNLREILFNFLFYLN